jgi:GNAT-like C-terminal domain/N-acyltransferase N-terminal domain
MTVDLLIEHLALPEASHEAITKKWSEAEAAGFGVATGFLDEVQLRDSISWLGIPETDIALIISTATEIRNNPDLLIFAKLAYWVQNRSDEPILMLQFPELQHLLPRGFGVFYLLITLQAVPDMVAGYRAQGIADNIIRDTLGAIGLRSENHRVAHGEPGILVQQTLWNRYYVDSEIYQLGRFEYKLIPMYDSIEVYRNRQSGRVTAVIKRLTKFAADGFVDSDGNAESAGESWDSVYELSAEQLIATPVSPYGFALKNPVTLLLAEWERVLGEDDWIIDMHIPPGGKMSPECCRESFALALDFFAVKFPDKPSPAIYCNSWIFNTQFERLLPQSNMAKFMRELYLFPTPSNGRAGFFFVFCREYDDLSEAPRDTSLQRAMLGILESGDKLRSSGMIFLRDDIEQFGTACYRNQ